jgi:superoxide dismutase, Fe-Mn family
MASGRAITVSWAEDPVTDPHAHGFFTFSQYISTSPGNRQHSNERTIGGNMAHKLPDLPYAHNALEPVIDEQTMRIHHGKHHQAYVNKLNDAITGKSDLENKSIEDLLRDIDSVPDDIRTAVRNNGGGHANHSLFWEIMTPGGSSSPSGELGEAINSAFGSLNELKKKVNTAGGGQFGSGWSWLVVKAGGDLAVYSTANQDSPYMKGDTPILGVDVWEHAYYLKYQNDRPGYLEKWWDVVNWDKVAETYRNARG